MSHITSRSYAGEKDFQAMLGLMARVRPPEHARDFPVKVDLEEALASKIVRANMRLWFDGDSLIAWAYVDEFNNLICELDNQYAVHVGDEIVEWGKLCLRGNFSHGKTSALYTNCRENHTARIIFLKQLGFSQLQDTTIKLARPLSRPIPEPELPTGFAIRPILGKEEAAAVASMHRAALGTEYMTTENRLIIMSTSEYDPTLDLVVITPDGRIAGNCICSVNQQEKIGFTDPISIHPQFQGMGLARALLLTGMKLLKERGAESAHLGTSGDNFAMQKTAQSVGFEIESRTIWFSKEII
jgi:ribosomal protein S18 acetylase RimI-like enzyme